MTYGLANSSKSALSPPTLSGDAIPVPFGLGVLLHNSLAALETGVLRAF